MRATRAARGFVSVGDMQGSSSAVAFDQILVWTRASIGGAFVMLTWCPRIRGVPSRGVTTLMLSDTVHCVYLASYLRSTRVEPRMKSVLTLQPFRSCVFGTPHRSCTPTRNARTLSRGVSEKRSAP